MIHLLQLPKFTNGLWTDIDKHSICHMAEDVVAVVAYQQLITRNYWLNRCLVKGRRRRLDWMKKQPEVFQKLYDSFDLQDEPDDLEVSSICETWKSIVI